MVIDDHTGDWPHQRFSVAGEEEVEVDCIIGASASERTRVLTLTRVRTRVSRLSAALGGAPLCRWSILPLLTIT